MNLLRALATISSMTLVSRILGLVRDFFIASTFRTGLATDAFFVAFRIPNLLRDLFAEGALSSAFVPTFAEAHARRGRDERLPRVGHHLVGEDDDRDPVFLGQVEGEDGGLEAVLHGRDGQDDDGVIPVGPPAGLHHISLRGKGGKACARPPPHHVHDHTGDFRDGRKTQIFLHQRKARAAGSRHGFEAAHRGADDSSHAGDLVFHLDELAAHLGQLAGEQLGDLQFAAAGQAVEVVVGAIPADEHRPGIRSGGGGYEVEPVPDGRPRVLLNVRSCDAKGLAFLRTVHEADLPDTGYLRRAAGVLKVPPEELPARIETLAKDLRQLNKQAAAGPKGGLSVDQVFTITVTGSNTFTYTMPEYPPTPATGSYQVQAHQPTITGNTITRTSTSGAKMRFTCCAFCFPPIAFHKEAR